MKDKVKKIHINIDNKTVCYVSYDDYKEMKKFYENKLKAKSLKREYKIGNIVRYRERDWYVIKVEGNSIKLLLKDILSKEDINKYSPDKWYNNEKFLRLSDNVRPPFNYEESYVKNTVLENFKNDLGIKGTVDLLTKAEYEELQNTNEDILKCNDWYWLQDDNSSDTYAYGFNVNSNGSLDDYNVHYTHGVRPVVSLEPLELFKLEIESN